MDVGRYSGLFVSLALSPPLARLLIRRRSYNPVLSHINTVYPVRGGMVLVRRSRFYFSLKSVPCCFLVLRYGESDAFSWRSNQLSAKLKLNAPHAYTWLEIVGARWGKLAHGVFLFFG